MSVRVLSLSFLLQQALSSPLTSSEVLVGTLSVVPIESLTSPVANEREEVQMHTVIGQADVLSVMADQCAEASPLHSDLEDTSLLCSSPPVEDTMSTPPASFSPPSGPPLALPGPDNAVAGIQASVPQATVPQLHFSSQAQGQTLAYSSPSPLPVSVSVPKQQQPDPLAVSARLSNGGEDPAVQQHTQSSE